MPSASQARARITLAPLWLRALCNSNQRITGFSYPRDGALVPRSTPVDALPSYPLVWAPKLHCTLLLYRSRAQETMSALAQQAPVDAAEIFANAVRAIFSRWTLLRLAVDQGWADGDEAQKADALVTRVLEMVAPSVRRVPDESEIADVLHESIEGTFNAQAEDGSVEEISRTILRLRAECSEGNVANALVYVQQQAPSLDASQGREDEAGEAEEAVVPAPAPLPVIDEDGFETVQRRRNPRRACAP